MNNVTRSHLEPVDGAAVDERREHAQAAPERVADRAHRQHHVQIGAHAVDEEAVHGQRRGVDLLSLETARRRI